jgi:hypothetical protein
VLLLPRFLSCPADAKFTPVNVGKLKKGMTPEQVESLIGPPNKVSASSPWPGISRVWHWNNGDLEIHVNFNTTGRVEMVWTDWVASQPEPTWLDRVRAWLGL